MEQGDQFEVTARVRSADGIGYSRGRWTGLPPLPESATEEQINSAQQEFGETPAD